MLCAWLSMGSRAAGQSVALDMRACLEPAPREVRAVLTVELHEQLLAEDESVPADARVVEVRCTRDQAELWLRGMGSRRTVALASVPPELRARLLALSVAELTRPQPLASSARNGAVAETSAGLARPQPPASGTRGAADAESARPQPPASDARGATDAESTRPQPLAAGQSAAATSERKARSDAGEASELDSAEPGIDAAGPRARPPRLLWVGAEVQATPLVGLGGALLFRARLAPWLAWSSALSLGETRTGIDGGKLRVLSVSLRTGLAWLAQGTLGSCYVGAGARGRWLKLSGEPSLAANTAARHFAAWSLGPALFAGASVHIAAPVFLALELELQHALREVRANVEEGNPRTLSPWRTSAVVGAGLAW
jgi:hypothetical protein